MAQWLLADSLLPAPPLTACSFTWSHGKYEELGGVSVYEPSSFSSQAHCILILTNSLTRALPGASYPPSGPLSTFTNISVSREHGPGPLCPQPCLSTAVYSSRKVCRVLAQRVPSGEAPLLPQAPPCSSKSLSDVSTLSPQPHTYTLSQYIYLIDFY